MACCRSAAVSWFYVFLYQQRCSRAKIIGQTDKATGVRLTSDLPNESYSTLCKSRRRQVPTTLPIRGPGRTDGLDGERVDAGE
ncbi:unnamed protein product [Tuwongella immobilis]|uniref:Uncharacterized protein n=1 Tax=Tuwongella immobilis TaxID=692036 RepID=A0A6C2YHS9_9BACT|nr:unnamed protein product [Tuwongella immobilis]VTR97056.1 unnamed protein product [Tuwongella immobilis]